MFWRRAGRGQRKAGGAGTPSLPGPSVNTDCTQSSQIFPDLPTLPGRLCSPMKPCHLAGLSTEGPTHSASCPVPISLATSLTSAGSRLSLSHSSPLPDLEMVSTHVHSHCLPCSVYVPARSCMGSRSQKGGFCYVGSVQLPLRSTASCPADALTELRKETP